MGRNTYSNGYIQDNDTGQTELLNSPQMMILLRLKGEEFIAVALEIYTASSRHDATAPVFYAQRFGIREVHHLLVQAIEVYNDDPTAEWVEFGAHAGGKTPVLRYRPLGRAADVLEARAHV